MRPDRFQSIRPLVRTLLYEGYALFPYGAASLKNRRRLSFGELGPGARIATEIVVEARPNAVVEGRLGLLQPVRRTIRDRNGLPVSEISLCDREVGEFVEAREIEIAVSPMGVGDLVASPRSIPIEIEAYASSEAIVDDDGQLLATIDREARRMNVELRLGLRPATNGGPSSTFVVAVELAHRWSDGDPEISSLHSPHLALAIDEGAFVSIVEPEASLKPLVEASDFEGWWPVLVGAPSTRDLVLLSPIILYDYPALAPESPGDLFDATENDELLTLSILALTEDERRAMRGADPRAEEILARCDKLGERLGELHGATRSFEPVRGLTRRHDGRVEVGDAVRLRTRGRDSFDSSLDGQRARVVHIAVEVTGKEHVVVVLDEDPGRDMGLEELGVGHRFFVARSEVERIDAEERP